MKTPYGKECPYFYGDYRRGRNHEECRLLSDHQLQWESRLCEKCKVPEIRMANACENMELIPSLEKLFFIGKSQIQIKAYCHKTEKIVEDPRIGCGKCHPIKFVVLED